MESVPSHKVGEETGLLPSTGEAREGFLRAGLLLCRAPFKGSFNGTERVPLGIFKGLLIGYCNPSCSFVKGFRYVPVKVFFTVSFPFRGLGLWVAFGGVWGSRL